MTSFMLSSSEHSFATPRNQLFAFPSDVISSMLNNPSSHKGLMKLYQTCKYFYGKRSILIADDIAIKHENQDANGRILLMNLHNKDISHLRVPVWVTNCVYLHISPSKRAPKLFYSSIKHLIVYDGALHFEDFVFLASENLDQFSCGINCYVYHSNNSKASAEDILQLIPNIRKFRYFIDENISLEVLTKMEAIKFNHKFEMLRLKILDIHPTFDINLFCEFILKNSDNNETRIELCIADESKAKFRLALQKLNPKWKNETNFWLKRFFQEINPNWEE